MFRCQFCTRLFDQRGLEEHSKFCPKPKDQRTSSTPKLKSKDFMVKPVVGVKIKEEMKEETGEENEETEEKEKDFEVEKIMGRRQVRGRLQYLVKWRGFSEEENSWEPVENLDCPDKIGLFEARNGILRTDKRFNVKVSATAEELLAASLRASNLPANARKRLPSPPPRPDLSSITVNSPAMALATVLPNTPVQGGTVTPHPLYQAITMPPSKFVRTTCSKATLPPGIYSYRRNNGLSAMMVVKTDQGTFEEIEAHYVPRDSAPAAARVAKRADSAEEEAAELPAVAEMVAALGLPGRMVKRTSKLFLAASAWESMKEKAEAGLMAACLYVTCRQTGLPQAFQEVAALAKEVRRKEVHNCFKLILQAYEDGVITQPQQEEVEAEATSPEEEAKKEDELEPEYKIKKEDETEEMNMINIMQLCEQNMKEEMKEEVKEEVKEEADGGQDRKVLHKYVENQIQAGVKGFVCTICGKFGNHKNNLLKHIESKHFPGTFLYKCPHCDKEVKTKNALNTHMSYDHKQKGDS